MPALFLGSITNSSLPSGIWDFQIDYILRTQYGQIIFWGGTQPRREALLSSAACLSLLAYTNMKVLRSIDHQGKIRIGVTIENQAYMPAVARQHEENRGWADRPGAWHEAVRVWGSEKTTVGHTSSSFISKVKVNPHYQVINFRVP